MRLIPPSLTGLITWMALCVVGLLVSCSSAPPSPLHVIKRQTPGSSLPYMAVDGRAIVPLNRSYGQLTAEEQALIRAWYEDMPASDEPPFPRSGLYAVMKAVSDGQQRVLTTGDLFLVATVDSSGQVEEVKAYGDADPTLVAFVSRVIVQTPFKPAVCGQQPCRMDFPFKFRLGVR